MKWYGLALQSMLEGKINWMANNIKVMLTTSSYTPDQDTHQYKSDVTNEITGAGYTTGGKTLANKSITYTAGTNVLKLDADDLEWTSATITARTLVVYSDVTGADTVKPLLGYHAFDTDKATDGASFIVAWDAGGILKLTAS